MKRSWAEFLQGSGESGHGVQVYRAVDELADSVATYLAPGFEAGEPAAVVLSPGRVKRTMGLEPTTLSLGS